MAKGRTGSLYMARDMNSWHNRTGRIERRYRGTRFKKGTRHSIIIRLNNTGNTNSSLATVILYTCIEATNNELQFCGMLHV